MALLNVRRLLGVVATALLISHVAAGPSALKADGKVHELTAKAFSGAIKSHPLAFVEFYAPWCGHCKKLAPEWEKTAKLAQEADVPVAKVDAIAEKSLAKEQGVESFPTLRLFRGVPEVSKTYNGPRTAEKMVEWLSVWRSAELVESVEASGPTIKRWVAKKSISLLGVLSGNIEEDVAMRAVLEAASFALNPQNPGTEVPVGEASSAALQELGLAEHDLPCVVLIRDFDFEEKLLVHSPPTKTWKGAKVYGALMDWLKVKRVPALIPAQKDTEQFFLTDVDPGNGLVMLFGGSTGLKKDMHELAVAFMSREKRLKWVHAKADDFGEALGKNVDLTPKDFPEVVLWEFGESEDQDKTFRLSQQMDMAAVSKASIESFVKSWQAGELAAEKDPVQAITGDTFDDLVIDNDKDVLVEFYAPWCGHCKALAPEYKQLAMHYAEDPGVAILKMDATVHKHESAKIEGYPTLKFYAKGAKSAPTDPGFKAGRDKASLVDFIEKNRKTVPKTGKGSKKGTEKSSSKKEKAEKGGKSPSATEQSPSPAPTPAQKTIAEAGAVSASSVWVFDDATDPQNRGKQLSVDMVASRKGFTLVQVADLGLLIFPSGEAKPVRRFGTAAAAAEYVKTTPADAGLAAAPPKLKSEPELGKLGRLPCPVSADLTSCKAWCEGVWSGEPSEIRPTLGGKTCAELVAAGGGSQNHDGPSCMCYDSEYKALQAMCLSPCTEETDQDNGASSSCKADDSSCGQAGPKPMLATGASSSMTPATRRFLLYDTKYGEGFNLQREVYPRAGWVVAELNKAAEARCGSNTVGDCARWTLVLPPWCRVVHWWSGPAQMPWSTFFDEGALKQAGVPLIEFAEYVKLVGGQHVDLALTYQTDKLETSAQAGLSGSRGGFLGWAKELEHCSGKYQKLPDFEKLPDGELSMVYAGHCEGGIRTRALKCGALDGPWPRGVVDMLQTLDSSTSSVFIKGYDYLLSPDAEELDELALRESMLFSRELRDHAANFIRKALGGRKYLAAHCRRTDFLRVRTKTTPSAEVIAAKLNLLLAENDLDQVFIATDAPADLREDLQKHVKGAVHFYDEASGAAVFDHPGKQAAVEIWIAAMADFFIGTIESRFTMWIQLERGFLGKPKPSSEQEFCKEYTKGPSQKCIAPHYRQPTRKGSHREEYQS